MLPYGLGGCNVAPPNMGVLTMDKWWLYLLCALLGLRLLYLCVLYFQGKECERLIGALGSNRTHLTFQELRASWEKIGIVSDLHAILALQLLYTRGHVICYPKRGSTDDWRSIRQKIDLAGPDKDTILQCEMTIKR